MYRSFRTHKIRKTYEVDSLWDFKTYDGSYDGKITVPACWESIPTLASYKGKGIYTKNFNLSGPTRFVFKGVSHTADVYCDEKHIARHYNAYTPFSVDFNDILGEHEIKIIVDNEYSEASALHVENDYYTYGGITRPLLIEELASAVINYIHFAPSKKNEKWSAKITVCIENMENRAIEAELRLSINDKSFFSKKINLSSRETSIFEIQSDFEEVIEYSLKHPKLYYISAELFMEERPIDDLIERVGFREIKCIGKKIFMNDEPILLLGVNRHEDYNSLGCSIPQQAIMRDIALIRNLGANAVRTCHYPNDELFLDFCDELGILVWEEEHARGLSEEQMKNPNFITQSKNCINEMILNHYNHPAIFCWGILNECASNTEYGRICYSDLYSEIKKLDNTRPMTSASNKYTTDMCLDLADIVSMNIYPEWYSSDVKGCKGSIDRVKKLTEKTKTDNKPLIISEIGAGGIYGFRSETNVKWTEERQAEILDKQLSAIFEDDDIVGVFVWQFADTRVDEFLFPHRPYSRNNKGLVDQFRRKKIAFATVKKHFTAKNRC